MVRVQPGERASYVFVIDTETYAGNFERQLGAFCTGQVGECEVGADEARDFFDEEGPEAAARFAAIVRRRPDDRGVRRPASIWPTPGWHNDGYGTHLRGAPPEGRHAHPAYLSAAIFFRERPDDELVAMMIRRARAMAGRPKRRPWQENPKPVGFRLIEERVAVALTELPLPPA